MTLVKLCPLVAAVAVVAVASACSNAPDSESTSSTAPSTTAVRPLCETALPAAWQEAIAGGAIKAGGISTVPLAVGPAGEIAAVRDNGDTRDVLLIAADKSVTEIYPVPEPNKNNVGSVAMDDRWIVVGVDRIPRNSNGVIAGLIQVDVIDRHGGPVRTVAQESDDDYTNGRNAIDSVALFDGKVYWITRETYSGTTGTVSSFDLATGAVEVVASGAVSGVRATAAGVAWVVDAPDGQDPAWKHAEVKVAASPPPAVADALGPGLDRLSLVTDGTAYAWITGLDKSVSGIAWWAPDSGAVRVTGEVVVVKGALPPVYVVGPFVVIGKGRPEATYGETTFTTIVDTRSGAVTELSDAVAGADGGTIGVQRGGYGNNTPAVPVVLRTDALPALTC